MSNLNSDDANTIMPPPKSLTFKLSPEAVAATKQPIPIGTIDPKTGQPKRGPGRPVGSTSKRQPPSNINAPMTMRGSLPPREAKAIDPVDDKEAIKEQKKLKAEQYATYINQELNDKLFMLISGMPGSPFTAAMFYKENKVPPQVATNPNFSELGNAIAIPADVASSWGKVLAELSYTDIGKNVSKATDNPMLGIVAAVIAALYSTYRYSQQLKPILEQIKAMQAMKEAEANGTTDGTS